MTDHLVIPDAHAVPGVDNDRFELAGRFALAKRPSVIVCLGDWYDMESLSLYDKGKKSFEGRRYHKDIEVGRDALRRFNQPIVEYNARQRDNKKTQYRPRKIMLIGNHENRIVRAIDDDCKLEGTMGLGDLGFKEYGWETHPFLKMVNVDGVWYSHYFVSGVMAYPISGVNPARAILNKHMSSCTSGHTHIMDTAIATGPSGKRALGLVAGCFFTHSMPYAHATEHMFWRGLFLKRDVVDGEYDLETWSMRRLEKEYG